MLDNGYGIIPNMVLFSEKLTDKEKLVFCLISSLTARNGICTASNEYIAQKLNCEKWTISKAIGILSDNGFIDCIILENYKREITLGGGIVKNHKGDSEKSLGGIVKNHKGDSEKSLYNNINNNINKYYYYLEEETEEKKEKEKNLNININSLEEFRLYINKGKIMEDFFYKISNNESFEMLTADFWLYCEDKGKILNKKTAETRFRNYLKPKWETEEDRKIMKESYNKKLKNINTNNNFEKEEEEKKEKEKEKIAEFKKIESILSDDEKRQYRQQAEEQVHELTKGRGAMLASFGLLVQNRYIKNILDNKDKYLSIYN